MKLVGSNASIESKASGNMQTFLFFCEDHYWLFVIINQCKKQSPCFEQLYVCVCVYIYVASLRMCFFVIYQKLRYNTLQIVIWKLWYYSLYRTIFVQTRLYESLFIATTDCVQVNFSNIDCMEAVIVEWLLWYAQVIIWNIICPNQIIQKFIYCYYKLCSSRFFQYRLYGSCYCGMVFIVCIGNCMEHYLPKPNYMEVYLLLLQIVSKYIFPIQCMEVFIVEWLLWYAQNT